MKINYIAALFALFLFVFLVKGCFAPPERKEKPAKPKDEAKAPAKPGKKAAEPVKEAKEDDEDDDAPADAAEAVRHQAWVKSVDERLAKIKKTFAEIEAREKVGVVTPGIAALRSDADWKQKDDAWKRQRRIELVMEFKQLKINSDWKIKNMEAEANKAINPLVERERDLGQRILWSSRSKKLKDKLVQEKANLGVKISKMRADLQRDVEIERTTTEAKQQDLKEEISKLGPYFGFP